MKLIICFPTIAHLIIYFLTLPNLILILKFPIFAIIYNSFQSTEKSDHLIQFLHQFFILHSNFKYLIIAFVVYIVHINICYLITDLNITMKILFSDYLKKVKFNLQILYMDYSIFIQFLCAFFLLTNKIIIYLISFIVLFLDYYHCSVFHIYYFCISYIDLY